MGLISDHGVVIGSIQINTTWSELRMQRIQPIVAVQASDARMDIDQRPSVIRGDNAALDRQTNRLAIVPLGRDQAAENRAAALTGIARRAQEGRLLATQPGAIAQIAADKVGPSNAQADLRLAMAAPMRFDVTPGGVEIRVTPPALDLPLIQGSQMIDATWGDVRIEFYA